MTKEFTGGDITQRLVQKHVDNIMPAEPAVEKIVAEIFAAARQEDGIIRYFRNCESTFANLGEEGFEAINQLDEIKVQILDLLDAKLDKGTIPSFDELAEHAKKIHQLNLTIMKSKFH